jgi:hypothetical protein
VSVTTTGETVQATAAAAGQESAATTGTTASAATGTEAAKTYDETYVKKLRDEAAAHRTKLKAFEDAEQARKDAELTATQLAEKKAADAEAKVAAAETRAREALGTAAITVVAAAKARRRRRARPEARHRRVRRRGQAQGRDKALAALVKAHPYLIAAAARGPRHQPGPGQRPHHHRPQADPPGWVRRGCSRLAPADTPAQTE